MDLVVSYRGDNRKRVTEKYELDGDFFVSFDIDAYKVRGEHAKEIVPW